MKHRKIYIWQQDNWPNFSWDEKEITYRLGEVRAMQGRLVGKMTSLGFNLMNETLLEALTTEVIKSSEIEGEILEAEQVRSSVARHLGMDIHGLDETDRYVEGVVQVMMDATDNYNNALTAERLFDWHAALFPTGRTGMYKITVGNWRQDDKGAMQVVSGAMGKERVHYQAPDAKSLDKEMSQFLNWTNANNKIDPVLKAAIAHFWFVSIHPFDDGNGRIARTIADLFLTRADDIPQRFYSMSAQIQNKRKEYYDILEKSQKGNLDITQWIAWFLDCLKDALIISEQSLERILKKANFWEKHRQVSMNERQTKMINLLWDGFVEKLTSSKWAKINKCSTDTALRDIKQLVEHELLIVSESGGRSTSYDLVE